MANARLHGSTCAVPKTSTANGAQVETLSHIFNEATLVVKQICVNRGSMADKLTALNNFKENPAYQLGDKVAEICAPLFNNFPINYFGYSYGHRSENNQMTFSYISSNKDYMNYWFQAGNPVFFIESKMPSVQIMSFKVGKPSEFQTEMSKFNLYNGIGIQKRYSDCSIEAFEFHSPNPNADPINFGINKNLLNQFILYFKNKSCNILKTVEQSPLCLPENKICRVENPFQSYLDFCQMIKTKKVPLKFKAQEVFFTRREFDILSLLAKGKTMREIATILKISPRTVETYLYNAKNKTNTFTVSRLLDCFQNSLF